MNNTIKMVLHCGKRVIELDERTLYETGALHALAHHFEASVYRNKPSHPYWLDVFSGLAELAHDKSCDHAIASDQFRVHVQRLNNGGRDPYSPTLRKRLEKRAEHDRAVFIQREQEQLEQDG